MLSHDNELSSKLAREIRNTKWKYRAHGQRSEKAFPQFSIN